MRQLDAFLDGQEQGHSAHAQDVHERGQLAQQLAVRRSLWREAYSREAKVQQLSCAATLKVAHSAVEARGHLDQLAGAATVECVAA